MSSYSTSQESIIRLYILNLKTLICDLCVSFSMTNFSVSISLAIDFLEKFLTWEFKTNSATFYFLHGSRVSKYKAYLLLVNLKSKQVNETCTSDIFAKRTLQICVKGKMQHKLVRLRYEFIQVFIIIIVVLLWTVDFAR